MTWKNPFHRLRSHNRTREAARTWYRKGRKDALRGDPAFNFEQSPKEMSKKDITFARAHYEEGTSSVDAGQQELYARLLFEIIEWENLAQSPETNDPSRAWACLAETREELALFEKLKYKC